MSMKMDIGNQNIGKYNEYYIWQYKHFKKDWTFMLTNDVKTQISYTQISTYNQCEYKWKLRYIDKIKMGKDSIYLIFGTAMHIVLQKYVEELYKNNIMSADSMDLNKMLVTELKRLAIESKEKNNELPCTKDELIEFTNDGIQILDWIKKYRKDYFPKTGFEFIGYEIPLDINITDNIKFIAYLDLVIKDNINNKILIKDFKTSTSGWKDYHKKDESKTQQLLLYKKFYSDKFNVPVENIDVEYIILKRKLYTGTQYPQKRVQLFSPASGKPSIKKVMDNLQQFIHECYDYDGNVRDNNEFAKKININNCKFCEYNGTQYCDASTILQGES